jgi:cell division inhibitor SulA
MKHFIVTHRIDQVFDTQNDMIESFRDLWQNSGENARWLKTWYAPPGKMFCEWTAESHDAIRACFSERLKQMAPIVSVDEVVLVDPEWLGEAGQS